MKKLIQINLSLLLVLPIISCMRSERQTQILDANLDNAKVVTIESENIIWLETSDSSVIYDISNISNIDGNMLVQSRTLWKIFSDEGKYLGEVAHKGDAPEDFLWMGNIWNDDSLVYMYDANLNKIQKYDNLGRYHGYDTIKHGPAGDFDLQPEEAYITKNDGVFYVNTFMGMPPFNKMFCHASDINSEPKVIEGRRRENGNTFYNRIYVDNPNHRLLYWEHIKDTLFAVNVDSVYPLFVFNYGKNAVPSEIAGNQSVVQRFMSLHDLGDNEYAYPMRYFQMHDGKIYFIVSKSKQGYIGCIDEPKNEVAFTEFKSPEGMRLLPQMFFKIVGDDILLSVIDENQPEANPGLLKFPISELNKP